MADQRQHPDAMCEYDDGSCVYFVGCTGGAHPLGMWGALTLDFVDAHGNRSQRTYRALDLEDAQ